MYRRNRESIQIRGTLKIGGNAPESPTDEDKDAHAKRVALYVARREQHRDMWTGKPLPGEFDFRFWNGSNDED